MDQARRDRIIELIRKMRESTVDRGCTPADEGFRRLHPSVRTIHSRSGYDPDARVAGRRAGKTVGLRVAIEEK